MERFEITSPIRRVYENGAVLEIQRLDTAPRLEPGWMALHEAYHIEAAGEIVYATIVPDGDALGTTQPVKMTAAAAGAPAGVGCSGGGMDLFIAQHVLGVSPESAMSQGRAAVSGKEEEVYEDAVILEERKTIGQGDVDEARERVRKRRKGIHPVHVKIKLPRSGETKEFSMESFRDEIAMPNNLLYLPAVDIEEDEDQKAA